MLRSNQKQPIDDFVYKKRQTFARFIVRIFLTGISLLFNLCILVVW